LLIIFIILVRGALFPASRQAISSAALATKN
jgi:hypothetical protein